MANTDRDAHDGAFGDEDEQDREDARRDQDRAGKDRVIGKGMNSLDSTQAPLKSETGEPDWDAMSEDARRKLESDE